MSDKIYQYWYLLKNYNDKYYEIIAVFRRKWEVVSVKEKLDSRFHFCHYISSTPFGVEKKRVEEFGIYLIEKERVCAYE